MGQDLYIGRRGRERWLRAPAPRTPFQPVGWSAETQQRGGRLSVRRSVVTHQEYELSWGSVNSDTKDALMSIYRGEPGREGLIHWLDPMLMGRNILPYHWSNPAVVAKDGTPHKGTRPTLVATTAAGVAAGLPQHGAQYAGAASDDWVYIPVPPGWNLRLQAWGTGTSAAAAGTLQHALVNAAGAIVSWSNTTVGAANAENAGHLLTPSSTGAKGVAIRFGAGNGAVSAIYAAVSPTPTAGASITRAQFISGNGNSGCEMPTPPALAPNSAFWDKWSVSAVLKEVGP